MINWIQDANRPRLAALALLLASALAPGAFAQAPAAMTAVDDDLVELGKWRAMPLINVLTALEELTGRSVVRPESLPTPTITFDSRGAMTREEAILAIESLLSINGIGVAPMGDRFLKVVAVGTIKTEAPELVVGTLADRPSSGGIVSRLFRLQYLDSQTFQTQIQPFLSPAFGSITPFTNSNAVIVTDTVTNLKRLEYVVAEVDKPSRLNIDTRFYTLQYAEAAKVADQMQGLIDNARNRFGTQNASQQNGANRQGPANRRQLAAEGAPSPAGGGESAIPEQILFGSSTAITSDERTNQLIIMTEPANFTFFDDIIAKLDVKADPATKIEVIPLKYATATEVASLLSQFVSGTSGTQGNDVATRGNAQGNRRNNQNQQQNVNAPNPNNIGAVANQLATQTLAANRVGAGGEDRESQFSAYISIVADERSNALIISGTRNDLELMRDIVDQVDVLLAQVRIEVIIADVSLMNGDKRGIDAFNFNYKQNVEAGSPNFTGIKGNLFGIGVENGSAFYDNGIISNVTMDVIVNRAKENSDINLLSSPSVTTTHNREATITSGQSIPVTSSTSSDLGGGTRSNVTFQEIVVELKVLPLIGPNNVIQLEIDQKIDDVAGSTTINGDPFPIIGRRQATSFVSVNDGDLVVLGGLQRFKDSRENARPALIGDIPLIGKLFGSRSKSKERSELLVFIRPKVIRTSVEGNALTQEIINRNSKAEEINNLLNHGTPNGAPKSDEAPQAGADRKFHK